MIFLAYILKAIPLLLSVAWITGAFLFYFTRERGKLTSENPPKLPRYPRVSILIPCHNEERTITATIISMDKINYPNYEVIAINDGSIDRTSQVLRELSQPREYMRTIDLIQNRGKAAGLNSAMIAATGEFILCVDADSELHPNAVTWLVHQLLENPNAGAVTGNPRVKNRNSLIGRLQVGEFSATVGVIKRFQQIIGKLFTVSGVIVAYRKSAIMGVGLWDTESVTEDIAISWRLQTNDWDLVYEPRALCDVLMPGTLKGLWRQRMRWAQGGFEVMSKYSLPIFSAKGNWRLKAICFEYFFSVFWSFGLIVGLGMTLMGTTTLEGTEPTLWFSPMHWGIFLIGLLGLIQFLPGFAIHGKYEKHSLSLIYWSIWYPFVYWSLNTAVLLVAIPKTIFSKKQKYGTWISPDRGGE